MAKAVKNPFQAKKEQVNSICECTGSCQSFNIIHEVMYYIFIVSSVWKMS